MHSCNVLTALNSAADSSTTILLVAPSLVTLLVKGLSYSKSEWCRTWLGNDTEQCFMGDKKCMI